MTVENILLNHNLKITSCRRFILNELLKTKTALSENEIKASFPELFDRVTFYRTLKTLETANIIHKIVLHDNSTKYALSHFEQHQDTIHSHFHCVKCDEVICLHGKSKVEIQLPQGFISKEINIVIEGLCTQCLN